MAIGRLAHLGSQVTLSTGNSASVTVPNDGSVAAGDLLLAACVMPSGSRTFAISGGGGAWTSLGTASQAGHMSQVWWRLATAGDLGATITITPNTGAIRQVMLLGKVSGVDQSTPVAATSTTLVAGTTKTTPSASPASTVREVGIAWDTRGGSTPQTSAWTAPSGHTRQGQAFTTAASGSCSGAWGDSDTTVSGAIGSRVWTADQSALGSAWTLSVKPGPTVATLTLGAETDTAPALPGAKAAPAGAASATETGRPLTGSKTRATVPAGDTSSAQALTGTLRAVLGVAGETGSSPPATGTKTGALTVAGAHEDASPLPGSKLRPLGPATSPEAAQPFARHVSHSLGQAVESADALTLTTPGRIMSAVETGHAVILNGAKHSLIATPISAETARAFARAVHAPAGTATSAETALALVGRRTATLGTTYETAAAQTITGAVVPPDDVTITLGPPTSRWETAIGTPTG